MRPSNKHERHQLERRNQHAYTPKREHKMPSYEQWLKRTGQHDIPVRMSQREGEQ